MTAPLLILLHGVGARGADLMAIGHALTAALPGAQLAAPDAPEPFDQAPNGRQWFSVAGVTAANRPARVVAARTAFDATIADIVQRADNPDRVVLIGFSQGAIMALDALARGHAHEVIAFSGRLPLSAPPAPKPHARALLVHGEADPVIPTDESRQAAEALRDRGCHTELLLLPNVGHVISPAGLQAGLRFLAQG